MKNKRIVFFGMGGEYSSIPLKALIDAGAEVAAVVFPRIRPDDQVPRWMPVPAQMMSDPELMIRPVRENILSLAGKHGIPVLEVGSMKNKTTLKAMEELKPDLVIVACFPQIFPKAMLDIPKLGCLNIHPSLLPAYRGPDPFFWQFRAAEENMGVTVHWMDEHADTGDILGQVRVEYPEGISANDADRMAAQAGTALILEALKKDSWPCNIQDKIGASYQQAPHETDKVIPTSWGVQRAFGFMRAADVWAPFWIEDDDGVQIEAHGAIGYELGAKSASSFESRDGETWVQMSDGVLRVG